MGTSSARAPSARSLPGVLLRWARRLVVAAVASVLVLYLGAAFRSRGKPDLAPWHTVSLASEFRVRHGRCDPSRPCETSHSGRRERENDLPSGTSRGI